jgi:hypothetical protein
MKTKTYQDKPAFIPKKTSSAENRALANQTQEVIEKLESITVKFELSAADFTFLYRAAAQELRTLQPSAQSQDSKRAYLNDETKRRVNGGISRTYEIFLCSYKASASQRKSLLVAGKRAEADSRLAQAISTLAKLELLDEALTKRIS